MDLKRPGDDLEIGAFDWNDMKAMLTWWKRQGRHTSGGAPLNQGLGGGRERSHTWAWVKNTSSVNRSTHEILGLGGSFLDYAYAGYSEQLALNGTTPTTATHTGRFGVTMEPIPAGRIGKCVVAGVTQCKLNVVTTGDRFAEVTNNNGSYLTTASSGSAQVLDPTSGIGQRLGIIRIGPPTSTSEVLRAFYHASDWNAGGASDNRVTFDGTVAQDDGLTTRQDTNRQIKIVTAGWYMLTLGFNPLVDWGATPPQYSRMALGLEVNGGGITHVDIHAHYWSVGISSENPGPHTHTATVRVADITLGIGEVGTTTRLFYRVPKLFAADDILEVYLEPPSASDVSGIDLTAHEASFLELEPLF
jgi:hypothetical protein